MQPALDGNRAQRPGQRLSHVLGPRCSSMQPHAKPLPAFGAAHSPLNLTINLPRTPYIQMGEEHSEASTSTRAHSLHAAEAGSEGAPSSFSERAHRQQQQQLIRHVLRESHAAEAAATKFFSGQKVVMRSRPDAALLAEREAAQLLRVQNLMPRCVLVCLMPRFMLIWVAASHPGL